MLNTRTQNQDMKHDGLEAKNQASKDWEYCSDLSCHGSFPCARHPNRKKHVSKATRRQQAQEEHGETQVSKATRRAKTVPARPVPSPRGSQSADPAAPLEAKQAHGIHMELPKPSEKRKAELQSAAISPLPDTSAQRKFELKESFDVSSPRDIPEVKKNRPQTPFQDVVLLPHGDALLERGQEPTQGVTENPQSVLSTASLDATEHAQPPVSSELNLISSQDAEGTGQARENSTHDGKAHEHAQMAAENESISAELDRISAQGGLAEGEVQQPKSELPTHEGPSGATHLFPEASIAEIIASIPDSPAFPTQQAHVLPELQTESKTEGITGHQRQSSALALPIVDQKEADIFKGHPKPSELASPQPQLLSAFLAGEPTPRPESPYEALAPRQPSAALKGGVSGDLPSDEIEATKEQTEFLAALDESLKKHEQAPVELSSVTAQGTAIPGLQPHHERTEDLSVAHAAGTYLPPDFPKSPKLAASIYPFRYFGDDLHGTPASALCDDCAIHDNDVKAIQTKIEQLPPVSPAAAKTHVFQPERLQTLADKQRTEQAPDWIADPGVPVNKPEVVCIEAVEARRREIDDNHSAELEKEYTVMETTLAKRNHGMQPEALRYDVTPAGMHYLMIHFDVPAIDEKEYVLTVGGEVGIPMKWTLSDLKSRPAVTADIVMECSGNGRTFVRPRFNKKTPWNREGCSQARWTGCNLRQLLNECELKSSAVDLVFTGYDKGIVNETPDLKDGKEMNPTTALVTHYQRSLNLEKDDIIDDCILAYEMNGQPLLPQHGYPLRLVVPGWYGESSVKWLARIDVVSERFQGHFMRVYSHRINASDPLVRPVTIIRPRALLEPPGVPHVSTRCRSVEAGLVVLRGRAWVGGSTRKVSTSIAKVEISLDKGLNWKDCNIIKERTSLWGWYQWEFIWNATVGVHTISVRATDSNGFSQATLQEEEHWNYHGQGSTLVQHTNVNVVLSLKHGELFNMYRMPEFLRL